MKKPIVKYERIRNMRVERGLSQQQVAEHLHVQTNTYSQYETGTLRYPLSILRELAIFYDTSIDYLIEYTDCPIPHERSPEFKRRK